MPVPPLDQLLTTPAFTALRTPPPAEASREINVDKLDVNATERPDGLVRVDLADGDRYRVLQAEICVQGVFASVDFYGKGDFNKRFTASCTLSGDTVALISLLRNIADRMEGK